MTVDMRARSGGLAISSSGWSGAPRPRLSNHARLRAAQRNLAEDALRYVMTYGREYHRTGAVFFVLCKRDIPRDDLRLPWVARLAGAVALVSGDGEVITLYRNGLAIGDIKRKMKYRLPWKDSRSRKEPPTRDGDGIPDIMDTLEPSR